MSDFQHDHSQNPVYVRAWNEAYEEIMPKVLPAIEARAEAAVRAAEFRVSQWER